ncbi:MAG: replication restart helicase PriA [Candidatus Saccharicenans sp.]|uniref:replication restart helicase PriA n=1 Tax=Candidatus Saccharicenans sp. TaxID=2819258 RepID=UPI004049B696
MSTYCEVLFSLPVFQTFLYRLPDELAGRVRVGSRVIAPLGSRKLAGYVVEIKKLSQEPEFKVKEIASCPEDQPGLPEIILKFAQELSERSLTAPGLFLEMAEPPAAREKPRVKLAITEKGLKELLSGRLKGCRGQILSLLVDRQLSPVYIRRKLKIREINSYLRSLSQDGLIEVQEKAARKKQLKIAAASVFRQLLLPVKPEGLPESGYQLLKKLESGEGASCLLTGSLKLRQEFLQKIIEYIGQRHGFTLVLVPEINRLEKWQPLIQRLASRAVVWHSQLTDRVRQHNWNQILSGRARVIFGTRSALFLPIQPLSLLVVDEEQDDLYYQAEGPAFEAREAARIRAGLEKSLLIYSSDCPRVSQFYHHLEAGSLIHLGGEEIFYRVDYFHQDLTRLLKKELREEISQRLEKKEQVFFLVNRKGYAGYLFCPSCGFVAKCEQCRIALSLQKKNGGLTCSYCGQTSEAPADCPVCRGKLRPGRVRGSQYLREQLQEIFSGRRVEVLEEGVGEKDSEKIIRRIKSGKSQLVVGTEYAVRRLPEGLFSMLCLVNPETGLNLPDFLAGERTLAIIFRALDLVKNEDSSRVVAVTAGPEPELVAQALARNYRGFWEREIEYRRLLNYPPFSCLVEIGLDSRSLRRSGRWSRLLLEELRADFPELELIGPRLSRKIWQREKREVKLMIRLPSEEKAQNLLASLKEFRQKRPAARLRVRVWQ